MAIRIGIVGCGAIANLHAASYQKLGDRVELVACCDVEKERADAFVERYGFKKSYSDEKQMLEECELDAVSVCTWNSQHKPCTMLALDAGVNVLCEKPMAMNTAEALEMEECARRNGKLLMIGFVRRHGNDAATALDFINKGYLGDIYCAKVSYLRRAGFPGNWFGDKSYSGGGPLIDLGVHMIDLSMWLMGNPTPVAVSGCTYTKFADNDVSDSVHSSFGEKKSGGTFDVEDLAMGFIRFDNGASMQIEFSWASNIEKETRFCELRGDKAGAYWSEDSLKIFGEEYGSTYDTVVNAKDGDLPLHANNIFHFADVVLNGAKPDFEPIQGLNIVKILEAMYKSAAEGREIAL